MQSLDVSNVGMAIIIRSAQRRIAVLSYRYAATASRSYRGCSCALKEQHSVLQVPDCQSCIRNSYAKEIIHFIPSDLIATLQPGYDTDGETDL
jgi:hypothetical protein